MIIGSFPLNKIHLSEFWSNEPPPGNPDLSLRLLPSVSVSVFLSRSLALALALFFMCARAHTYAHRVARSALCFLQDSFYLSYWFGDFFNKILTSWRVGAVFVLFLTTGIQGYRDSENYSSDQHQPKEMREKVHHPEQKHQNLSWEQVCGLNNKLHIAYLLVTPSQLANVYGGGKIGSRTMKGCRHLEKLTQTDISWNHPISRLHPSHIAAHRDHLSNAFISSNGRQLGKEAIIP